MNGAWCWFSDPRAIYSPSRNRVYVGWVSQTGDIMARQIDASGDRTFNIHPGFEVDDHDNPSFVELPNGRVVVFYQTHNAADLLYRITDESGDLVTLGAAIAVGLGAFATPTWFSYCNPVFVADEGRLMIFFRQSLSDRNVWWVAANQDQLATNSWSGYKLWDAGPHGAYLKAFSNGTDRVELLLTDGHPAYDKPASLYHARFRYDGSAHWENSAGTAIASVPFGVSQVTQILSGSTVGNAWVWQITHGPDGKPRVLYSTYPGDNSAAHRYGVAQWTGSAWVTTDLCAAGKGLVDASVDPASTYYTAGACFDGSNPDAAFLARQDSTGWRIERWVNNSGWAFASIVSPASTAKQFRPFSPADGSLFWFKGRYVSYFDYEAGIELI